MNNDICRVFTLFHDKSIIEENTLKKPYISFGFFDWFETEMLGSFHHEKKTEEKNTEKNFANHLNSLYNYNIKSSVEHLNYQSYQNFFGFRNENNTTPNERINDTDFWKPEDEEYPLKFIVFLQLKNYVNIVDKINTILFNKTQQKDIHYLVYNTLDINDFIICFKSKQYKAIIEIVNELYDKLSKEKIEIVYTYTNLLVERKIINNKDISSLFKTEEKIDSISIKTILNTNNTRPIVDNIQLFTELLAKELYEDKDKEAIETNKIVGYEILGDTDCRFIARDVPLSKILNLFTDNGLLIQENYIKNNKLFLSTTTSLNSNFYDITKKIPHNKKTTKKSGTSTFDPPPTGNEVLSNKINTLNSITKDTTLYNQLSQIVKYMSYAEKRNENKYEYNLLYKPICTLLNLLIKTNCNHNIEEFYTFINNIYANIQSNMRADIRFFHISDFSVIPYYLPTKLRVFYSALINDISKYYISISDTDIDYQFILTPTNLQYTYVEQMLRKDYNLDKLMVVNTSEKDFYNIKNFVFQLAHEAAHFVGDEKTRNRAYRFELLVKFLLSKVYESSCILFREILFKNNKILEIFEDQKPTVELFVEKVYPKHKDTINESILYLCENNTISNEKQFYYSYNISKYLSFFFKGNAIKNIYQYFLSLLIDNIKTFLGQKEYIFFDEFDNIISTIKSSGESVENKLIDSFSINLEDRVPEFDVLLYLMTESYSDLSAILTFDVEIAEYFQEIYSQVDDDINNSIFIRGCIVSTVLSEIFCDFKDKYNDTYYNFFHMDINDPSFKDKFSLFKEDEKNKKYRYKKIVSTRDYILENKHDEKYYVYLYIKECAISHCKHMNDENRKQLSDIYNEVCRKNLMNSVQYINNYVEKIKNNN